MKLNEKLNNIINQKKWYKIDNTNYNSAGLLLERILGIEKNDLPIPDYGDTELKTKFNDSLYDMTLFHAAPDSYLFEIKRIYNTYGYPSPSNNDDRVFLSSFSCTKITQLGINIAAKLFIDWESQKLVLKFYNFSTNTIDDKVSWSFEMLKQKLELKLKKLCYVYVERKYIDKKMYCKFYKYIMYEYKGFESFFKSLQYGHICVKFCINTFKSGKKIGQMHDHGTCFDIGYENLCDIYEIDKVA